MNGKAGVFSEDGGLISHRRCSLNKVLPKAGVTCFYDTFVLSRTLVFQINFSAETPRLRQYPKRYQ
jgi:hypothetical protein